MEAMSSRHWITVRIKVIPFLIAGVFLSIISSQIHSKSLYTSAWNALYPSSSSGSNAQCALCHSSTTGGGLNDYGLDMWLSTAGTISSRIVDIEGLNSDSDPTSSDNLAEINANSQPGWTGWAPAGVAGDLDPATTNQPPTADAGGPYSGTAGVVLTFDGSGSSDSDGTIVQYDWVFVDGSSAPAVGPTPSHTFDLPGAYAVTVTVTDDDGDTDSDTTTVMINAEELTVPDAARRTIPVILQLLLD